MSPDGHRCDTTSWSEDHLWSHFSSEALFAKKKENYSMSQVVSRWKNSRTSIIPSNSWRRMSKICLMTVTTGIICIGFVWYRQMYTFDGNSSLQKVNEVVNRFWTSHNIISLRQLDRKVDKHQIVSNIITPFKPCFGHFSSKYSFFLAAIFVRQMQAGNWKDLMWCKSTSRPSWTFWRELAQDITKLLRTRNESNFKHFPWSQKAGQYLWTSDWR